MKSFPKIAIVDTETTGLDRRWHEIFEIALITGDPYDDGSGYRWKEYVWHLEVNAGEADPGAFRVNSYYQRLAAEESEDADYAWKLPHYHGRSNQIDHPVEELRAKRQFREPKEAALEVAALVASRTLIGAVPDFDAYRLEDWLRANGQCGAWDYHLVDVETLVAGFVRGYLKGLEPGFPLPAAFAPAIDMDHAFQDLLDMSSPKWKSTELLKLVGVEPPQGRHTALADCRWARDAYCKVYNVPV